MKTLEKQENIKLLLKTHSQFARPTKSTFLKLMKHANVWDDNFDVTANELYEYCDICKKFQKTLPQPAVAVTLGNEFNDIVTIYLKYW